MGSSSRSVIQELIPCGGGQLWKSVLYGTKAGEGRPPVRYEVQSVLVIAEQ